MDFVTAVKTCFKKYFSFSGRARRSEYWWFYLFTVILGVVAGIIDGMMMGWQNADSGPVGIITSLAVLIPSLAVSFRRLHDTNRSGWWIGGPAIAIFIFAVVFGFMSGAGMVSEDGTGFGVIAIVGLIAIFIWAVTLLVFMCIDSDKGDNKYGHSPKYGGQAVVFD